MKTAIVVLFVLVAMAVVIGLAVMMFVMIKVDRFESLLAEQKTSIKDHEVNIENLRQGGQLQNNRLNIIENKLGVTPK